MRKKFALVGYPLGHSMSSFIHNRLFDLSKIEADYSFIEIANDLEKNFNDLKRLDGFNITLPHKQNIIPLLDEIDENINFYNAVNVVCCKNGKTKGYNTDSKGFMEALAKSGFDLKGRAVLCGAGGTANVMAYEILKMGFSLDIAIRESSTEKANILKKNLEKIFKDSEINIISIDDICGEINLLVNATPVGMFPNIEAMPIAEKVLEQTKAVFDAIYNPKKTLLIQKAEEKGAKVCVGMPMLIWQAVYAHKIWYNADFNQQDIEKLIDDSYIEMQKKFK